MGKRIRFAYWGLHIGGLLYALLGLVLLLVGSNILPVPVEELKRSHNVIMLIGVVCLVSAIFCEFVVKGLKMERFWAWVSALVIFSLFLFSLFFPLGVIGFMGLLESDTRKRFNSK